MAEVFYKGSLYRFYKSKTNGRGTWICKEGSCLGHLTRTSYVTVPIVYWSELKNAAIEAGYSKEHFQPTVVAKPESKKTSKKKSNRPTISIF
tara:strand:+ start:279 stop:554 length:276 start_codon:yes stop_codon:yes gene_type:complete